MEIANAGRRRHSGSVSGVLLCVLLIVHFVYFRENLVYFCKRTVTTRASTHGLVGRVHFNRSKPQGSKESARAGDGRLDVDP